MDRLRLKEKVVKLRKRGKTYSEIKAEIKAFVPKSTLSNWCQKVILPSWYKKKVAILNRKNSKKALNIAWEINRKKRNGFLEKIKQEASVILKSFGEKDF